MADMKRFCGLITDELQKITDKGLTQGNVDIAYKLVDMYKDIKNTEYWETKTDYYMAVLEEMNGGYSQGNYSMTDDYPMRGRKRDSMGRYSRNDGTDHDNGMTYAKGRRSRGYSMDDGYSMYEKYMDSKQSYRNDRSQDGKQRLMESLEDYMDDFTEKIKEMHRDADTPEEKEMIGKFMTKLQNIR